MAKPKTAPSPPPEPLLCRLTWDDQKRPRVRLYGPECSWSIEVVLPPDCTDAEAGRIRDAYAFAARNDVLELSPRMRAFPIAPEPTDPDGRVADAASHLFLGIFPDAASDVTGPELRPADVEALLASKPSDPVRRTVWRLCCLLADERRRAWTAWERVAYEESRRATAERDAQEDRAAAEKHSAAWSNVANEIGAFVHVARALVRLLPGSEAASRVLALAQDLVTPDPLVFPSEERARKMASALGFGALAGLGILGTYYAATKRAR